jgi:hypothetical protein
VVECTWTWVGVQRNSNARWLLPWFRMPARGKIDNSHHHSSFSFQAVLAWRPARRRRTPSTRKPPTPAQPLLFHPRAQSLPTPIPLDLLGFPCPASTPLDRAPDRGQSARVSHGGGERRRPRSRPATEAASSSPPNLTRSEAAVAMVGCMRCIVGGG